MLAFTAHRCLRLLPAGTCYAVYSGDVWLGTVYPVACSLEYPDELLWSPALAPTPKIAARQLLTIAH